jgi:thymidylate kinase
MKVDRASNPPSPTLDQTSLPEFAGRDISRPFVVALEGANGAGKSTLCRILAQSFGAHACLGTDEAWFSEVFKTRMIRDAEWYVSAMFFLSGCLEQMRVLRNCPQPLIIMDRSLWSTLAVQGGHNPERLETLLAMLRPVAAQIHVPDLTLVLDASFETCQSRIARKSGAARRLDDLTANAAFHAREQAFYRWLARHRAEVRFLNANPTGPETIAGQASALITETAGERCQARHPGGPDGASPSAAT